MFEFLKSLTEQDTFDEKVPVFNGTNGTSPTGVGTMATSINNNSDVKFSNDRNSINSGNDVNSSDITNYLDRAKEINDGVECVGFAVELDDGKLVKLYVNKNDAEKFEDDLANALGTDDQFEDILMKFSDLYDIVDVIWPDDTYGTTQQTSPDAAVQDGEISDDTSAPDSAPEVDGDESGLKSELTQTTNTEQSDQPASDDQDTDFSAAMRDFDDLYGSDDGSKSEDDASVGKSTDSETPSPSDETTDAETSSATDNQDESSDSVDDGSTKTNTETTDTETNDSTSSEDESNDSQDSSDAASTKTKTSDDDAADSSSESTDDDVSVVIHPKKKKISESVEDAEMVEKSKSDLFKMMGLDSQYSSVGAKISTLIGKRILALVGFIGIPGSMLTKIDGIDETINAAAESISANSITRSNFNKIFHKIISTEKSEKYTDVEYRSDFLEFLNILGVDFSKIKTTRQGISAILFGAHCVSDPETRVAFHTFMDNFNNAADGTVDVKESIGELGHDDFSKFMKSQHSNYREWLTRAQQLKLFELFKSGSQVNVYHLHADDGPARSQIPHGEVVYGMSNPDEFGLFELISIEK